MCGIITVIKKDGKTAFKQLLKGFERQKDRGTEGFGFVSFTGDKVYKVKRAEHLADIKIALEKDISTGIMFHHRLPTSTPNYRELAHPIRVSNKNLKYNYYVIHNGVISNATELRTQHEKEGYTYTTICKKIYETINTRYTSEQFNDSEALAIELSKAIDTDSNGVFDVNGSIAFMVLQTDKEDKKIKAMYYGRNSGNPLKIDNAKEFLRIASEGQGETVDTDELFRVEMKDLSISKKDFTVGKYAVVSSWGYDAGRYFSSRFDRDDDYDDYDDIPVGNKSGMGLYTPSMDEQYNKMKKNKMGFVWLKGTETEEELAVLYNRYDYELQKAIDSRTEDKIDEYTMRLEEVNDMYELLYNEN